MGERLTCAGLPPAAVERAPTESAATKRYRFRLAPKEAELEFVVQSDVEPAMQQLSVRRIEVREPGAAAPRETLEVDGDGFVPDGIDLVRVQDLNFDGYGDLAVTVDAGATGNTSSVYWLYEPSTHRFQREKSLDALPTVVPDAEHKVLKTFWKGGMAGAIYTRAQYRWHGKRLELIREEAQDVDPSAPGGEVFVRVVRELKGGKLRQIEKKRLRYSSRGEEIFLK